MLMACELSIPIILGAIFLSSNLHMPPMRKPTIKILHGNCFRIVATVDEPTKPSARKLETEESSNQLPAALTKLLSSPAASMNSPASPANKPSKLKIAFIKMK